MSQLLPLRGFKSNESRKKAKRQPTAGRQEGICRVRHKLAFSGSLGDLYTLLVVAICCHNLCHYLT